MKTRIFAVLNLVLVLATITVNALANIIPFNGQNTGAISDSFPNLFVPAGLTFAIWGLIYLLMVVWALTQLVQAFSTKGNPSLIGSTFGWFAAGSLANMLWVVFWHWTNVPVTMVLMLVLLACLLVLYLRIARKKGEAFSWGMVPWRLMVSVYLGWITVATVANVTALLVSLGYTGGENAQGITLVILGAVMLIGVIHALTRADLPYILVLVWALIGIYIKRVDPASLPSRPLVGYAALGVAGVLVLAWIIGLVGLRRRRA